MYKQIWTGLGVALLLCACETTPQTNATLDNARSAVQSAEADPNVARYAGTDLETARQKLAAAEAEATHHDDSAAAQSAYLATQNAHLAQLHAAAKADDARVAAGQAERDSILLAQRTREADAAKAERDQEADKSARLQAEVNELNAKQTDRGLVLTLADVLFATGKADLNPGGLRKLDQLAQFLKEHADRRVEIDGYTDSVGTDAYNLDLSQRRALAVQSALVSRGIDVTRIAAQGYGKEYPVASNAESGGRQLNRRVEVIIGGENNGAIAPLAAANP
jgi:outer membrane protein OmpA-like peptidoglycan-associated protein